MILSKTCRQYFKSIQTHVLQGMASHNVASPFLMNNEPFFTHYECLRSVWLKSAGIKAACATYQLSRSTYYELEKRFVELGLPGLFILPAEAEQLPDLEELVLIANKGRPSLSYTAIHRIAQAVPLTRNLSTPELVSSILQSHGYGISNMKSDIAFWGRIQRTLHRWETLRRSPQGKRDTHHRKATFFIDQDPYLTRLELLRELFFNPEAQPRKVCFRFAVSLPTYYRLVADYTLYGPWAIFPARSYGSKGLSDELQLIIRLESLKYPAQSSEQLVQKLKLKISRFAVHRVRSRWGLNDKTRSPIALDEYIAPEQHLPHEDRFAAPQSAYQLISENNILTTRRINRHFELICEKMAVRHFHICDPGPFLLAPFVNELGIPQAFESYGPPRLRGKEISNLALLNIFRIVAGYRRINHLSDNRDRAVALASGIGFYGSTSKYYEKTTDFSFEQLHHLRGDLVTRAKELALIDGLKVGFDFHFKEFYGNNAEQKMIGKGPNKAGNLVPGFRPHVAWDLATNVIISMAYFQGGTRAPRILQQFCEHNIFPFLDPRAIEEIYMDSEYTKEADFHYLKEVVCRNGDIYVSLKRNKQIKKLSQHALDETAGWEPCDLEDESKMIAVQLPKSGLPLTIVILRNRNTKQAIRCFGTTNNTVSKKDILHKYRYRWLIENGIKDLVTSYFVDEMYGYDPEKIEFELYCVMVARLAYESFLKELGGKYLNNVDGNKYTLQRMRNLLFEKRNCTIGQDEDGNFVLTLLDSGKHNELEQLVAQMLHDLKRKNKNKVLWWNQRSILLQSHNQYRFS